MGALSLKLGVIIGPIACVLQVFPTGDLQGKYMARQQPVTVAAMEALFIEKGRSDRTDWDSLMENEQIDNPMVVNSVLSFLIYGTRTAEVKGLNAFPKDQWPPNMPLLFYAYHIMVGLGTWFLALMAVAVIPGCGEERYFMRLAALASDAEFSAPLHC